MESAAVKATNPAIDLRGFRRALGKFATGVTVVTSRHGAALGAVTANSFASVSLDPPLVLWSLSKTSQSFPVFMAARHFAINVLTIDQIEISRRFASSGASKYEGMNFGAGEGDVPIIAGSAAIFECEREIEHDSGDHVIMVGRVRKFTGSEREALVFSNGSYARALSEEAPGVVDFERISAIPLHEHLVVLLLRAFNRMLDAMTAIRDEAGVSINESRILNIILSYPDRTLDEVEGLTYLSRVAALDAIASLKSREMITETTEHELRLTPSGRECISSLLARVPEVEAELLGAIAPADVSATRRVLERLVLHNSKLPLLRRNS